MNSLDTSMKEQEVIDYLTQKKIDLLLEAESIERAICTLKGITPSETLPSPTLSRIRTNKVSAPDKYNPKLKIDEKIMYAVKKLINPDKADIVEHLLEVDPKVDKRKLEQNVSTRLSVLRNSLQLDSVKEGARYKYSLWTE